MGNVAAAAHRAAAETGEEFDERIARYKILCLDGEEEIEKNIAVRKHHAERKQHAVNGSRCTNSWIGVAHGGQQVD